MTVLSVAFSPDGKLLASGSYYTRLWDVQTGIYRQELGNGVDGKNLAFSPDGKTLMSAGGDNTVRLLDVKTGIETSEDGSA